MSTAYKEDGSLSGVPLKGEKASTIFGDVTTVFPLIVAAALERISC